MVDVVGEVMRHLPRLRRYAHAVAGDREQGDARVRACLEAFAPGIAELGTRDLRLLLYRTLHQVWSDAAAAQDRQGPSSGDRAIIALRLQALGLSQRQLLALTALEGFTLAEAAAAMGLTVDAAAALLRQAKAALRAQPASRVLIIEDEPVIALDIAATLEGSGHTVVGIAATHRDAVAAAETGRPELILADIQLADGGSGLEAVIEILDRHPVPVVFVTAFPERLLSGARPEPSLLVAKPFDAETLRVSIAQALCAGGRAAA